MLIFKLLLPRSFFCTFTLFISFVLIFYFLSLSSIAVPLEWDRPVVLLSYLDTLVKKKGKPMLGREHNVPTELRTSVPNRKNPLHG